MILLKLGFWFRTGTKWSILFWGNFLGPVYVEVGPQIGEVACGGSFHLSCNRDKIKLKDYTGGLPNLSELPHLPGVPHLHVNRPLVFLGHLQSFIGISF